MWKVDGGCPSQKEGTSTASRKNNRSNRGCSDKWQPWCHKKQRNVESDVFSFESQEKSFCEQLTEVTQKRAFQSSAFSNHWISPKVVRFLQCKVYQKRLLRYFTDSSQNRRVRTQLDLLAAKAPCVSSARTSPFLSQPPAGHCYWRARVRWTVAVGSWMVGGYMNGWCMYGWMEGRVGWMDG